MGQSLERYHAVRFYEDTDSLSRLVANFIVEGWRRGQPALIVATEAHRRGILAALEQEQFDTRTAQITTDLLILDADETLRGLMKDGMPDAARFADVAGRALATLGAGEPGCIVRAYGEMVDLLWKQGAEAAAIRLEMLWNKLAVTHDFALLCGYAMEHTYRDAGRAAIHQQHTHVLGDADTFAAPR